MSVGQTSIPVQSLIGSRILVLREQRVMLDSDLAELYGVETRTLVQALKRNLSRFPGDFMFQLDNQDVVALRSQIVISKAGRAGRRTFVRVRELANTHGDLAKRLGELEGESEI